LKQEIEQVEREEESAYERKLEALKKEMLDQNKTGTAEADLLAFK